MMRTVRVGYVCACAIPAAASMNIAPSNPVIAALSLFLSLQTFIRALLLWPIAEVWPIT
jgi:hypothetical protein